VASFVFGLTACPNPDRAVAIETHGALPLLICDSTGGGAEAEEAPCSRFLGIGLVGLVAFLSHREQSKDMGTTDDYIRHTRQDIRTSQFGK